jgi:hypothetical protein
MKNYSQLFWMLFSFTVLFFFVSIAIQKDINKEKDYASDINIMNESIPVPDTVAPAAVVKSMVFFKDQVTGICFASVGDVQERTIALVNCDDLIIEPIPFWSK